MRAAAAFRSAALFYPKSEYSELAKENINIAKNQLAGQEMAVGRYYLKRGNPLAALKRFQTVIKEHKSTPFYQESLYRSLETYLLMGVDSQALITNKALKKNFPDSKWTLLAYDLLRESGLEDK